MQTDKIREIEEERLIEPRNKESARQLKSEAMRIYRFKKVLWAKLPLSTQKEKEKTSTYRSGA
jgi:hypothetical protein